jgi:hypothetical protein
VKKKIGGYKTRSDFVAPGKNESNVSLSQQTHNVSSHPETTRGQEGSNEHGKRVIKRRGLYHFFRFYLHKVTQYNSEKRVRLLDFSSYLIVFQTRTM